MSDREGLRRLAEAATPGPYRGTPEYERVFTALEQHTLLDGWEHWDVVSLADAIVRDSPEILPPANRPLVAGRDDSPVTEAMSGALGALANLYDFGLSTEAGRSLLATRLWGRDELEREDNASQIRAIEVEAVRDPRRLTAEQLHTAIVKVDQRGCGGAHLMGYGFCQELAAVLDDATPAAAVRDPLDVAMWRSIAQKAAVHIMAIHEHYGLDEQATPGEVFAAAESRCAEPQP